MPSVAEIQRRFAEAILDPAAPLPANLVAPPGSASVERFAVYRNNVAVGLVEALRSAFPVVDRLVGHEFFSMMARRHAFQSPPGTPVLLAYGSDFPDFIARFEPAMALPYLADVARLEWAWLQAYHSAEAESVAMAALARVQKKRLPQLRLIVHPSAQFLHFSVPALTIWRLHQDDAEIAPIELDDGPERVLLVRPCASVEAVELSLGEFAFLTAVQQLETIAEAVTAALTCEPELDPAALMSRLFAAGVFIGFEGGATDRDQGGGE